MAGTSDLQFKSRDLKPYAEPVRSEQLREGVVYFSIQFADEEMQIPIVGTWVYAGRRLDPEDTEDLVYFQDVESYQQGFRYGSEDIDAPDASFQAQPEQELNHFFDYEHALNELLKCSLRRQAKLRDVQ
jgi:hypothetical protein